MDTSEYNTVAYQKFLMHNALGVALACMVGVFLAAWLEPKGIFGYICAFGVIIGVMGFFDHRRSLKKLRASEKLQSSRPTLRDRLTVCFPDISLEGLTDEDLDSMASEIDVAIMGARFGDPRGFAELEQDIRLMIKEKKK